MATNSNKDHSGPITGRYFLNLNSKQEINIFINNLCRIGELEGLSSDVISEIREYSWKIISSFTMKYKKLKSDSSRSEFRDASKRHQRCLNTILSNVIECITCSASEISIRYYGNVVEVRLNTIVVISEKVSPRSFSTWYNSLKLLSKYWDIPNQLKLVICRILTTLFSIVNEPLLYQSEKDRIVREAIDIISSPAQFVDSKEYLGPTTEDHPFRQEIDDIKETISLVKSYLDLPPSSIPIWARSVTMAIKRIRYDNRLFVYDNTNPVLSSNSSGTSYKPRNRRVTLPGLFASIVEPDHVKDVPLIHEFDSIVGFNQEYCINDNILTDLNIVSNRRTSVAIPQKKPKPRLIHILNNSEQDRLCYFHNIIATVLSYIQEDCTFDQSKGPKHISYVMDRYKDWGVYSLDLTNATDTFNIGLQKLIMEELLLNNHEHASVLTDTWYYLMTQETEYKSQTLNRKFSFSSGQAQGYLSSFPSFALEHHIVVLTLLRKWDPDMSPSDFYRILGDDLVITAKDDKFKIPNMYIKYINSANVQCGLTKGYIYNKNVPEYSNKVAEFAKYLIINGYDVTPIPMKLLMADTLGDQLGLLSWYSDHRHEKLSLDNVIYYISKWIPFYGKIAGPVLGTLLNLNVPGVITRSFKRKFDKIFYEFNKVDFTILKQILFHNILYGVINRLTSNKPFEPELKSLISLRGELSVLLDYIDDPSYVSPKNKLSILRDNLYNTNQILSEFIRNYTSYDELSEDDINIICMYMNTNNIEVVKKKLTSLTDGISILLEDEDTIESLGLIQEYCMKILGLMTEFSISIDRSWSSFGKKAPSEYITNLKVILESAVQSAGFDSIEDYLLSDNFTVDPQPVEIKLTELETESSSSFLFDDECELDIW